ncbi:MAG TPA: FAD-dependent oxidoreductase [Planctomycetaceae bacterium]
MNLDVLIFGGGAAGMWLLDHLARRGDRVLLLEAGALGQGQTVGSQGIIHGGLKYTLQGLLTPAAREIREMPEVWRQALAGQRAPDLRQTRLRSNTCHLWRSESLRSRLGMLGAKVGLHVAPQELAAADRPPALAGCPGPIARLDEQVIDPASFIADLARQHRARILQIDARDGFDCLISKPGIVERVVLSHPQTGRRQELYPRHVVLTAGAGNSDLRHRFGLPEGQMQRRPLQMVLVRGDLPVLNGHCVDGARTRVTITSDRDSSGRTVWQVGGQLAEEGVSLDEIGLISRASRELAAVLPGVDLSQAEWATYRIDRAERATPRGGRPDTATVVSEGRVISAWPTKLALVPQLARMVEASLPAPRMHEYDLDSLKDWPRPPVAQPPWESPCAWQQHEPDSQSREAA